MPEGSICTYVARPLIGIWGTTVIGGSGLSLHPDDIREPKFHEHEEEQEYIPVDLCHSYVDISSSTSLVRGPQAQLLNNQNGERRWTRPLDLPR